MFELAPDEIVIDAGAAFGDSLIKFAKRQSSFTKWYAFDPDPHLASELSKFVEREYPDGRAVAISTPLAEKSEEVSMIFLPGTGNTRVNRSGTNTLQASSIDDYIKGDRVSIIKMDVEGSELALLRGARDSIRRYKPKLLISCYHEVEHLFQIPELISEFRPDYRFYLRNHTWATEKDSWPSSFFCESVIYAL